MKKRAILLSGGIDSTALAALEKPDHAYVVDYGQVCARAESVASQAVAAALGIPVTFVEANCAAVGTGDLCGRPPLPGVAPSSEWWPYRNQLLVTLAAPLALSDGMEELLIAAVSSDAFHADGTAEFFVALDSLLRMQEGGLRVYAPALSWSSKELVSRSCIGPELLGWTHSCHTGDVPCGTCRGCCKHFSILADLGFWP